jgi:hypothetical protein
MKKKQLKTPVHLLRLSLLAEGAALLLKLIIVYAGISIPKLTGTCGFLFLTSLCFTHLVIIYFNRHALVSVNNETTTCLWKEKQYADRLLQHLVEFRSWMLYAWKEDRRSLCPFLFHIHFSLCGLSLFFLGNMHNRTWHQYLERWFLVPDLLYPVASFISMLVLVLLLQNRHANKV